MSHKNHKCLLLNADYSLLTIVDWKKALIWSFKYSGLNYGIEVIDFYKHDYILGSNNKKYPIPAVSRTRRYFKRNNQSVNFSRKNIFIRDNYTCQYCGNKQNINELTYDHVIPKSLWEYNKGTPTNWTNIVTACAGCNKKKGNKTPAQANMPLLSPPHRPTKNFEYLPIIVHLAKIKADIPDEWKIYIPESLYE